MNDVVNHTLLVSIPLLIFPTLMLLYALSASHEAFRNDFPEDIQQHMPPATPEDRRRGWLFGGIYLLTLLGTLVYSTLLFLQHHGGNFRLGFAVALIMEVMMLLIDLFIIDWLIICTLRPRWIIPPGTEDCAGWRDYGFHVKAAVQRKSIVANLMISLMMAGIAYVLYLAF